MRSLHDDAQFHDELNLYLVSGLTLWTLCLFKKHSVFYDALEQRACFLDGVECANAYRGLSWATLLYSVFDTLFILVKPTCTKRLGSLCLHHAATIVAVSYAMSFNVDAITAEYMLVEVSTFFLTVKNVRRNQGGLVPARVVAFMRHRAVHSATNTGFILSWVLLRIHYYPVLWVVTHHFFNHPAFGVSYYYILASLATLVVLNFYWTAELVGFKVTSAMLVVVVVTTAMLTLR